MEALDPAERGAGDIAFVSHLIRGWTVLALAAVARMRRVSLLSLDSLRC